MALEKATGLVIRSMNYGDNDKIITIFTREQGKITAMVKGARNTKSIFLGATQLFSYADFVYYSGRSFAYLNQVEMKESFHKLRNDLKKLAKAAYMAEAVYQSFEDGQGDERVLRLMLNLLYFMHEDQAADDGVLLLTFQLKLLTYLGFAPDLSQCVQCGNTHQLIAINSIDASAVCSTCINLFRGAHRMGEEATTFLRELQAANLMGLKERTLPGKDWMPFARALNQVLEAQIGRRVQSFEFLQNSV
jgi:DNA repair protein RecO (recombination protein O)